MDYQRFIQQLPELYENWGEDSVHPKSKQFQIVLEQVSVQTTANIMQLLNWAVFGLEEDEIYCQIGCEGGGNLIGALLNHPEEIAYAVDKLLPIQPSDGTGKCSRALFRKINSSSQY